MDPLTLLTRALVDGAATATRNNTSQISQEAYALLKTTLVHKFGPTLAAAADVAEKLPGSATATQVVQQSLLAANATQNTEILDLAKLLIAALRDHPTQSNSADTPNSPANTLNAQDINARNVVVGTQINISQPAPEDNSSPAGLSQLAQKLYGSLNAHWFDLNDLQDLAFQLNIDWDSLPGVAKPGKARALLQHCEKHSLLTRLQSLMRLARPNLRDQLQ